MQVSGLESGSTVAAAPNPDRDVSGTSYAGGTPGAPLADGDTAARDARFRLRDALRAVSGLDRLRDCGLSVLAGGVVPTLRNGRAGYAGVATCGSVHVCPCCSTTIRRVRQDELEQVGVFWECQSCGLVMMTLTMRHYERQALAELAEQQRTAWRYAFGQNAGRAWRTAKVTYGIRGFVRAWEVTHGANGWHCHYHVLLFLARPLSSVSIAELQHLAFTVWSAALERAGAYLPVELGADGQPVGVRIDAPDRGEAGTLARYLMKGQDGKTRWGVAAELTRLDVKTGSGGHRTPFEIARAAAAVDASPQDIALWREFEATATGMRSLYWSNGLRALLKAMGFELDDRDDGKVVADEEAAGERLAMIPAATWYRYIARVPGRALALLHAAERGGVAGIRALIEGWGLVWGGDVHPAEHLEPNGVLPTADEVLRRMERTATAERLHCWRRAFERMETVERVQHYQAAPAAEEFRVRRAAIGEAAAGRAAVAAELAAVLPTLPAAQAAYLAARRRANSARGDQLVAALARFRAKG